MAQKRGAERATHEHVWPLFEPRCWPLERVLTECWSHEPTRYLKIFFRWEKKVRDITLEDGNRRNEDNGKESGRVPHIGLDVSGQGRK